MEIPNKPKKPGNHCVLNIDECRDIIFRRRLLTRGKDFLTQTCGKI